MNTLFLKPASPDDKKTIDKAADIIKSGGVVAIPTETVYGLAANALCPEAVKKIFIAKGRPQDNPLIVHISRFDEIYPLVKDVPEKAIKLAEKFWPGPLTVILPKADVIPDVVTCGQKTVAVRMPSHKIASAIIRASGVPLAAPSANISGRPSPTTAEHVLHDLDGKIDAIVDGGECDVGVESTVITLCTPVPRLLRPGGITLEQLRETIGDVEADRAIYDPLPEGVKPSSPGMKYKHYSPEAKVVILKGALEGFIDYVNKNGDDTSAVLCFEGEEKYFSGTVLTYGKKDDPSSQAHEIFNKLRLADEKKIKKVFARCPSESGVGMAVYNRLLRAAAFTVEEV
ncbi:MAG: threonylcarbamoyl-AMP synthase [Clostridiales bacterium]|nr:threonylcarbamoyl-AMP synthase [Clostridiales bacterium]